MAHQTEAPAYMRHAADQLRSAQLRAEQTCSATCCTAATPVPSAAPAVVRVRVGHVLNRHRGRAAAAAGSIRPLVRAHAAPPAAPAPPLAVAVHSAPGTSWRAGVPRRATCPQRRAKVAVVLPDRAPPVCGVQPGPRAVVSPAAAAAAARPAYQAGHLG